ncbi:MAG: restriction endonuclease subunit S [Candidatus Electrothrix sp. ATG2]|nr:restriction endonuclease subunit S [Candidatus Electrothrix sp. ATG2]
MELPAGWQLKRLEQVSKVVNGGTPKTKVEEYWGGEHRWITPAEMGKGSNPYLSDSRRTLTDAGLQKTSAQLVPPWSVILSTRAPIGHLAINAVPMAFNQGCRGMIPEETVSHKFLYYFLLNSKKYLNELGTGTTFKELSAGKLKKVQVPLPSLPEQKRIVAIIDEAFAVIDQAVANTEKNLANAREVFESILNDIFSTQKKNELLPLSEITTSITDGDHSPPPKVPEGIPFITISNINKTSRKIDFSDTFKVPETYYNKLKSTRKPQAGDVLFTVTGSYGIPVRVSDNIDFCFQRHIGLLRPDKNINSSWLYYVLLSPPVFRQATEGATGTAQKTVGLRVLRNIRVPNMNSKEQETVVKKLDAIWKETQHLESIYQKKLNALAELKQSILHKAFTGELTHSPEQELAEVC